MTDVSPTKVHTSPMAHPILRLAVVGWIVASFFAAVPTAAQNAMDEAIGFSSTVSPQQLGPGSEFTIHGTITIDLSHDAFEDINGTIVWTFIVNQLENATIEDAVCTSATGASCEAAISDDPDSVIFSGEVADEPRGDAAADVEITGVIDEDLDREAILFTAETCGAVTVDENSSDADSRGRTPRDPSTPDPSADCTGVEGTIEAAVAAPPTPTSDPTEEPTATTEPTEEPTEAPTATTEPTEAQTEEPTATTEPTEEPTEPTEPTEEPTATIEPTEAPTEAPTATTEPTEGPTEEPTATTEPTDAATETPDDSAASLSTAEPTAAEDAHSPDAEAPRSTLEDDEVEDDNAGLWIGAGSLLILAAAAGLVMYQRRKAMV